jgi:ferrous iron transport protein B
VPTSARYGEGLDELVATVHEVATGEAGTKPHRIKALSPELEASVAEVVREIEQVYPDLPNSRWVALRLLDGDERIITAIQNGELGAIVATESSVEGSKAGKTLEAPV